VSGTAAAESGIDVSWDEAVVPKQHVERQLLPGADIHRFSDRRDRTTENGPLSERRASASKAGKLTFA
jgi:hypothetical protein